MELVGIAKPLKIPFCFFPIGDEEVSSNVSKPRINLLNYRSPALSEHSFAPLYFLREKEETIIESILKAVSSFQDGAFFEKVKERIMLLMDIDVLKEEKIIPSRQSFFTLFSFLLSNRDFCEKWFPSIFISIEGYAVMQYMDTDKNQFFNVKFLDSDVFSYIIINKNNTLFRLERIGNKETFFKNLEESQICP